MLQAAPWLLVEEVEAANEEMNNSLMAQMVKNPPTTWETWVQSLGWVDSPGGEDGNPLQYSCLENPHGQRSLVGYSPCGRKESDTIEQLSTQHTQDKFISLFFYRIRDRASVLKLLTSLGAY